MDYVPAHSEPLLLAIILVLRQCDLSSKTSRFSLPLGLWIPINLQKGKSAELDINFIDIDCNAKFPGLLPFFQIWQNLTAISPADDYSHFLSNIPQKLCAGLALSLSSALGPRSRSTQNSPRSTWMGHTLWLLCDAATLLSSLDLARNSRLCRGAINFIKRSRPFHVA